MRKVITETRTIETDVCDICEGYDEYRMWTLPSYFTAESVTLCERHMTAVAAAMEEVLASLRARERIGHDR
jgi:Zn ribbon nucleic-acid-binding protein